jgi:hypothetical protein
VALIFSPVTEDVLGGPFKPLPRHAFLMLHGNERRADEDRDLERMVCEALDVRAFIPIRATDIGGTGDYLEKIIALIRGCGFGVAIFSEKTPAPTLANIFFEVGICHVFGKPVVFAKSDDAKMPSDFTRTEWVARRDDDDQFRDALLKTLSRIDALPDFYRKQADVAMEADDPDYEVAFERYRQAILIGDDAESRERIDEIYATLGGRASPVKLHAARARLRQAVGEFRTHVPPRREPPPPTG